MPMNNLFFTQDHYLNITVTRKSQLMEKSIPMQIIINGYKAGVLKNGQTETFQVPGDNARLQAFLSMSKTKPFEIQANDNSEKNYLVESRMNNAAYIIGFLLVIVSTVLIFATYNLLYMVIAIPPALYHLYIRFVRKDTYLVIHEIKGSATDTVKEVF